MRLLGTCGHDVDDVNGEEPAETAQCAFDITAELSSCLRWPMKPEKAQAPAVSQSLEI